MAYVIKQYSAGYKGVVSVYPTKESAISALKSLGQPSFSNINVELDGDEARLNYGHVTITYTIEKQAA